MSNPFNLWFEELLSGPIISFNSKEQNIPLGINPEPEPLIGSKVKAPMGVWVRSTQKQMTVKDQKSFTVCTAMQLQEQSVFLF